MSDQRNLTLDEQREFIQGKKFDDWDTKQVWIRASNAAHDGDPDDALQASIDPSVYSPRFQKQVVDSGLNFNVQWLPIRVIRADGSEYEGFAIANILDLLPALDE